MEEKKRRKGERRGNEKTVKEKASLSVLQI